MDGRKEGRSLYMCVQLNKVGYTANTSRGWVGRGGNACFSTFRLLLTDRQTDGWTDRPTKTKPLIESLDSDL